MTDWLPGQNHTENKEEQIAGMNISIDSSDSTTDIPTKITTEDIQTAKQVSMHLQNLRMCMIEGWPSKKNGVKQDM